MKVAILAGGVGGARFVRAAVAALGPEAVSAIVNTGDDERFHGLFVSPDLDSVLYTLAGENDVRRGWGLSGESFRAFEALRRFDPSAWFQLGDRDLGTHLFRTQWLAEGGTLTDATRAIADALGVRATILPMSDQPVRTLIDTELGTLSFQQFHVRERSRPEVRGVRYVGGDVARPSPGVLEALAEADVVLVAPSNPASSIAPILAVPGIRSTLEASASPVVGLSGIRGGAPFRGDADRFMSGLGVEVSALGVARLYASWVDGLVIDDVDAALAPVIEALGLRVLTGDTALEPVERGVTVVERCLELAARVSR